MLTQDCTNWSQRPQWTAVPELQGPGDDADSTVVLHTVAEPRLLNNGATTATIPTPTSPAATMVHVNNQVPATVADQDPVTNTLPVPKLTWESFDIIYPSQFKTLFENP